MMRPGYVSMELDDESQLDAIPIIRGGKEIKPQFPYGLRISLLKEQIDKLNLEELKVGPNETVYLEFCAKACVTDVSPENTRVELQIEDMAIIGIEDEA